MKRVLYLTKLRLDGVPYGGLVRSVRLLAALRERFDVEVIGFDEVGPNSPRGKVASALASFRSGQPYQTLRYDTPWFRRQVKEALERFRPDAIHVDYVHQAPIGWEIPLPRAVDFHNVESALSAGIAASSRGIARFLAARDAELLRTVEARVAREYALITVPSEKEVARTPGNVHAVVNGVDPSRLPLDVEPDPNLVVFVGQFSWVPNIDGAEWFVRNVLPKLPSRVKVKLVGRSPDKRVLRLASDRVMVTGEVPDTWPYVSDASVVLAPLLTPGGTRHKILEGLLATRPVVSTPQGADGLEDLTDDGLVLAKEPDDFAHAIVDLLDDPARARRLGAAGRAAVIERYSWAASGRKLLDLYEEYLGLS